MSCTERRTVHFVFTLNLQNPLSVLFFLVESSDAVVTGHSSVSYIFQFHSVLKLLWEEEDEEEELNEINYN